jgi:hypothetical protein
VVGRISPALERWPIGCKHLKARFEVGQLKTWLHGLGLPVKDGPLRHTYNFDEIGFLLGDGKLRYN